MAPMQLGNDQRTVGLHMYFIGNIQKGKMYWILHPVNMLISVLGLQTV